MMEIDGKKIKYSIKNGKLVDPGIPTDGLVCLLDFTLQTNNDKHRATVLDLSGNGNNAVLQNFGFNEESGYVKGLSEGVEQGLRFDGVDDIINIYKNTALNDFTIYCSLDRDLIKSKELRFQFLPTTDSDYSYFCMQLHPTHVTFNLRNVGEETFEYTANDGFTKGINNVVIRKKGSSVDLFTATKTVNYTLQKNTLKIKEFQFIKKMEESESLDTLRNVMLYNRPLTDTEIQQLMEE